MSMRAVTAILAFFAITSAGADQMAAKIEAEELMNAVTPFAQQMLSEYGEFHPYGGAMKPDREIVSVAAYDGEEYPPAEELVAMLKDGFRAAAHAGEYRASAIVYDVRVMLPGTNEKSDAIAVALDHVDNYSVVVVFPYQIADSGEVTYGEIFATGGAADIFGR